MRVFPLPLLPLVLTLAVSPVSAGDARPARTDQSPATAADDALARLLAEPLTPGVVALLAEFTNQAAAQQRLAEAFSSVDPSVRAVAARVALATRSVAQVPALRRTLGGERDPKAAAEMVRALLVLRGADADAWILPVLPELGAPASATFVEVLARTRPESLKSVVAVRMPAEADPGIGQALAVGLRQNEAQLDAIVSLLGALNRSDVWSAALTTMMERAAVMPARLLEQALASSAPGVRSDAVWTAAQLMLSEKTVPNAVHAALAKAAQPPDADVWEAFGREMVARGLGARPASGPWADAIRAHPEEARVLIPLRNAKLFTSSEREALASLTGGEPAREPANTIPRHVALQFSPSAAMRTLPWPAPGVALDLLRLTGCKGDGADRRTVGVLQYAADGTIGGASIDPAGHSAACLRASKAALMMAVAAPHTVASATGRETVLIVFDREAAACADAFPAAASAAHERPASPPIRVGSTIKAPTKTRNLNPMYPDAAIKARIQGVVILDATISPAGCISDITLLRSVHPLLDVAAFDAVQGWRYTPTLVEGAPIPVIMTVTVNFALQQ
jgi:TonB family protein